MTGKENSDVGSDQDRFTRGVRDLPGQEKTEDGKFFEVEHGNLHQRDPEESQHNEAGQRVTNQGDIEFEKLAQVKNPEGQKISSSKPQTSL